MKTGFDTEKYLEAQVRAIMQRVNSFPGKLYLEFGGKLCDDQHAARVLPGYRPTAKVEVLQRLRDEIEIVYCVSSKDVQNGRIRGDYGLSYDNVTLRALQDLDTFGLEVSGVCVNMFSGEPKARRLADRLGKLGIRVYCQPEIEGYPLQIERIVSDEGYGMLAPLQTTKPVVIMTGAGPGSGKMSTCLAMIYLDSKRGISSGFAKWETFPVWNLPLRHPVNMAYEAATADIGDYNQVDPFHLEAYGVSAVNYNRDIENFAIVKSIIQRISRESRTAENPMANYRSPTDMGINMCSQGITDLKAVEEAARQEIIRRWFRYNQQYILGAGSEEPVKRVEKLLGELDLRPEDRKVVPASREEAERTRRVGKGNKGVYCGAALELPDGTIVRGGNSRLLHAESAVLLNAIKHLAGIPKEIDLLPAEVIERISDLRGSMGQRSPSLDVEETLIALAVSAIANPVARVGIEKLKMLAGCDLHVTHMPTRGDEEGVRNIGLNCTTDGHLTIQDFIPI